MPLAPGTNSPAPNPTINVIVNPQVTLPAPTTSNPNPTPVPVAPLPPVTVGAVTPAAANTIAGAVNLADTGVKPCTSARKYTVRWAKNAKSGTLKYRGRTIKAKKVNGRLQASLDLTGMVANGADYMKVVQTSKSKSGKTSRLVRNFKVC
jgi:hypothetical protein